jgi:hypothetical protein
VLALAIPASAAWSLFAGGLVARIAAALFGGALVLFLFVWAMGGHVSALPWWWGVQGERNTAEEIENLGPEWHCEHDVEHPYGNWDHVLVGPPGVFVLDSKSLHNASVAGRDALSSGRLRFTGSSFRSAALTIHDELERRLERSAWVQAVVVVWGEFPQARHEEKKVVYVRGNELVSWLLELPALLNGPQCAAARDALREIRVALATKNA